MSKQPGGQSDKERLVAEREFDTGNTFQLEDEDHTLANSLRFMLNKNMPHPSDVVTNVRVQTSGEMSATQAMRESLKNLKGMCEHVLETFEKRTDDFEAAHAGKEAARPASAGAGAKKGKKSKATDDEMAD